MFTPMAVNVLQQNSPHEGRELFCAYLVDLFVKSLVGGSYDCIDNVFICDGLRVLDQLRKRNTQVPLVQQGFFQAWQVPLLFDRLRWNKLVDQVGEATFAQTLNLET